MVYRSSLCYKDDTAPFCCVNNKCQTGTSDKWWWKVVESVCVVCVQYVKIFIEQKAFVDGINFLISFEENCC